MLKNKKHIYLIIIILVVLVLVFLVSYKNKPEKIVTSINKIVIAKSITSTGNPSQITDTFNSLSNRNIYMFVYLKNSIPGSTVSYIRYFNGYYVDSYSVKIASKTNNILYFNWDKTHSLDYPVGNYTIKVFVNGIFLDSTSFKVI